jgi:hypothetical protein
VHSSSWYGSCSDCCFFCRHDPHTAMWHDGGCSHGAWRPTCCSHWHAGPSCPHALQTMFAHAVALQECLPLLHMAGGGSGLRTLGGRADMALGDGGCCSEDARFAGLGAGDGLAVEDFFLVDLGLLSASWSAASFPSPVTPPWAAHEKGKRDKKGLPRRRWRFLGGRLPCRSWCRGRRLGRRWWWLVKECVYRVPALLPIQVPQESTRHGCYAASDGPAQVVGEQGVFVFVAMPWLIL